ncbi:ABC transporter substrate-binding protein [Gorillibacterium timonense]|uniref:ABC transporter substrate-binding protein n=1 Tax=Gorillibacterium timonense TaxID=1689269 RepID=UPI00071E5C54|nr:ABC transporter substrate-binding protein [Gorillibacterium timonense]
MKSDTVLDLERMPKHLLALLPCPLKVPLEEAYLLQREALLPAGVEGDSGDIRFEGNANQSEFYNKVSDLKDVDELPDIIISPGISSFFHADFRSRFLDTEVFADASVCTPNERFQAAGLLDPTGRTTLLCVNPLVMVIDTGKLDGHPLPSRWSDLLSPLYRKQITMRGHQGSFCETVLLTLRHTLGDDSLHQLGSNVAAGMHPGQMAKLAGSDQPGATAVYIMPYFYAKMIRRKERVRVVWPEDGAIASPVLMLMKRNASNVSRSIARFFLSEETAELCEQAMFPSPFSSERSSASSQTAGQPLCWMGWDTVWNKEIGRLTEQANAEFLRGFEENTP